MEVAQEASVKIYLGDRNRNRNRELGSGRGIPVIILLPFSYTSLSKK